MKIIKYLPFKEPIGLFRLIEERQQEKPLPKPVLIPVPLSKYKLNKNYSEALADYLNTQNWDRFCTFTTSYELTLKSARRLMDRTFTNLATNLFTNMPLVMFWCAEKFECKDGYHTHGLLEYGKNFTHPDMLNLLMHQYQISSGSKYITTQVDTLTISKAIYNNNTTKLQYIIDNGTTQQQDFRCSFLKFNKQKAAAKYCAKYLMKNCSDYEILFTRGMMPELREDTANEPLPTITERQPKYNWQKRNFVPR